MRHLKQDHTDIIIKHIIFFFLLIAFYHIMMNKGHIKGVYT